MIKRISDASNEAGIIRYLLSQTSSVIRLPGVEIPETELRPGVAKVRYPISVERAQRKETVHFPAAD